MARSVMVTGGAGFIGVNFVYHWVEAHPDDTVVVLDANNSVTAGDSCAPSL